MRFRVGLVAAFLALLLTTVTLITVTSYLNGEKSAQELSGQVLAQGIGRIDLRVQSQLDVAETQSHLNQSLIDRGMLRVDGTPDWDAIGAYLVDALTANEGLSYLSFGLEATGEACIVERTSDGSLVLRFLRLSEGGAPEGRQLELIDYVSRAGKLELLRREANKKQNDPRPRPYYVAAKAAHHAVWTETFIFFGESGVLDSPGVTYATPVLRADGSLLGVLTADFDLRAISDFLKSLRILEHGVAFVVEYRQDGTRRVIAHPSPEILTRPAAAGGRELTPVSQVSDARVRELAAALPAEFPNDGATPGPVHFQIEGTSYAGSFKALDHGGLKWVVCVVAPEEDILGAVWRNNRTTAAIVAASVFLAVIVALWLGARIAKPLHGLADDAEAIGRFELDSRKPEESWIIEIEALTRAMEEMKRGLRSFRKYVPADLVRDLLASGEEAKVGGKRVQLTIHFSDIAGFTSIAETLPPEQLMASLGEYLEEMTASIVGSRGTVDKYIGDAVMAFWGAPRPDRSHAFHACEAVLANLARLDTLNARWEAEGRPRLEARTALHTGDVVVGNVGSGARLNYTVIGDAVNLASRLEGLNKLYGTRVLISQTTWKLVRDRMVGRPVDRVSVKGKAESIDIYELMGKAGETTAAEREAARRHTEAFELYLTRKWSDAATRLRAILGARPDDTPAKILLERCERWIAAPPGDDWDGVERMTSK